MSRLLGLVLVSNLLALAPPARALDIVVRIQGQKQGWFRGDKGARKDERNIVATALTHEVISPRDPATGQATGRRMHKPLTITKLLDAASVQIFQALVTNENLPEVDIELREPSHAGAEVVVHRIVLTNASISDVATGVDVHNQPAGGGPRGAGGVGYEQVSFTYQKIEIDDGGLTALDDWSVNPT